MAEWQTRSAQDAVGAILWRFESSHPHHYCASTAFVFPMLRPNQLQQVRHNSEERWFVDLKAALGLCRDQIVIR